MPYIIEDHRKQGAKTIRVYSGRDQSGDVLTATMRNEPVDQVYVDLGSVRNWKADELTEVIAVFAEWCIGVRKSDRVFD